MFLPAEPLEILSGMCFGTLFGAIYVLIGYGISSFVIAYFAKKLGEKFIDNYAPKGKFQKVKRVIKEHPRRVEAVIVLLYLLPIIPKDIIPYSSGILKITLKKFMTISVVARIPAILSSTFAGSRILLADYKSIAIVYALTYLLSAVVFIIYYLNKKATPQES